jgi:DNA invertase Pin-like site-specific DNA recombinase
MKPRVYSYIRFSDPAQAKGDSERRQNESAELVKGLEATKTYALKVGMDLDDTLQMVDRGLSGFHGAHRSKGHLGRFLKCVENGSVSPGSILVIERISRLGRESVLTTLKDVIFKLLEHNISIVTLSPEVVFDKQAIETGSVFMLIGLIMAARRDPRTRANSLCPIGDDAGNAPRKRSG